MEVAEVTSKQLQTLSGAGQAPFQVEFNPSYIETGFGGNVQQQTFLDVVNGSPILEMGNNGDRSGGVARQAMQIKHWNRQIGPVGDPKLTERRSAAGPGVSPPHLDIASPPQNLQDFAKTLFSDDAKLLGLIKLSELVGLLKNSVTDTEAAIPLLQELTEYDGEIDAIADKVKVSISKISDQLKAVSGAAGGKLTYPDLDEALTALRDSLTKAADALPEEKPAALAQVWSAGQRLLRVLDSLSNAPLSAIADTVREALSGFDNDVTKISAELCQGMQQAAATALMKLIQEGTWVGSLVNWPVVQDTLQPELDTLINAALTDSKVWRAADPIGMSITSTKDKASNDLKDALKNWTEEELAGPLFDEVKPVLNVLQAQAQNGIAGTAVLVENVFTTINSKVDSLKSLQVSAANYCKNAVTALDLFLTPRCPNSAPAQTRVRGPSV